MERHALKICALIDEKWYEFVTIEQASEMLGISEHKVKTLMTGRKLIPGKLSYITVPEIRSRGQFGNTRVLLDENFIEVAKEIADRFHAKPKLAEVNRRYARHDEDY